MTFGRKSGVTNACVLRTVLALQHSFARIEVPRAIGIINHVVEVGQPLFLHELAQDVHVAIRLGVGGENVVIGNDDDALLVPDLGVLAELAFEHADGSRPAHIVRHQDIRLYPDIVASLHGSFASRASEKFFSQRHNEESVSKCRRDFNSAK